MFEQYKIFVSVKIHDEVTGAISLIARHFNTAEKAAEGFQKRMGSIKALFAGGTFMLGAGAAIAAPLLYATDKAAELQKQLIGIQIATRGSAKEMVDMRKAIEGIAGQTIFSNIDVAKQAKLIATGTGFGANQVSSLLPVFAKFADVQYLMKGTDFQESVTNLIRLAHTAQHYDAGSLGKYADLLTKASFIVPGGLGEVGHALKYSQGVGKSALGIGDENMVLMTALLNRLGLSGSRGGTNLIAAMTRTIPGVFGSGLLTGKSNEALLAMGMIDGQGRAKVFKDGKFDPVTWMGLMASYVQREFAGHPEATARQDIMKNLQHAYGVQGSRVASLLGSPQAIDQWRQIGDTFSQYGGVEGMQQRFANESVAQQYENAKTNFVSAMTELGYTLLPLATKYLKEFNGYMARLIDWMTKNPEKVKEYAQNLAILAAAFVGLGILGQVTAGVTGFVGALRFVIPLIGLEGGGLVAALFALGAAAAWLINKLGPEHKNDGNDHPEQHWVRGQGRAGAGGYWEDNSRWVGPARSRWEEVWDNSQSRFVRPTQGVPQMLQANIYLGDQGAKKIAAVTIPLMMKAAGSPQTGGSDFDGRMHLRPPGY